MNGERPRSPVARAAGAKRLDDALTAFEAAFAAQECASDNSTSLEAKVILGIDQTLMAEFLGADLGRYSGGTAEDQIVVGPYKELEKLRHEQLVVDEREQEKEKDQKDKEADKEQAQASEEKPEPNTP